MGYSFRFGSHHHTPHADVLQLIRMMDDILATITYDDALALVGKTYRVSENNVELTVTRVLRAAEHGPRPKELKRDGFSIFFRGNALLPQRMYTLTSESETFQSLFIVPVGRDGTGYEYEAVFT
jgi:hypothetical protein